MSGQLIPPPDLATAPLPDHLTVGQRIGIVGHLMNACDAMLPPTCSGKSVPTATSVRFIASGTSRLCRNTTG